MQQDSQRVETYNDKVFPHLWFDAFSISNRTKLLMEFSHIIRISLFVNSLDHLFLEFTKRIFIIRALSQSPFERCIGKDWVVLDELPGQWQG